MDEAKALQPLPAAAYPYLLQYPWHNDMASESTLYSAIVECLTQWWFLLGASLGFSLLHQTLVQRQWHESDPQVTLCLTLVDQLLERDTSSSFCEQVSRGMIQGVAVNQQSCLVLIKCFPHIHLTTLLLSLINLTAKATTERADQVGKGLIAKALLQDESGDLVLVYCDLIR
ncbi:hypothetical protein DM01DRAFT_1202072 [Hesseltinella vesiculosa]|uniref:Uncharacterized protein n=1 Tax=Hesseltinella vesiculosa TaxID=101127 RepID=A0A1X2G2V4_9FUNG|nr:hypothetical protein DM01DRAFT_1202072 [Hesseltinella vesiculosa]